MTKAPFDKLLACIKPALEDVHPVADVRAVVRGQSTYTHRDLLAMALYFLGRGTTYSRMQWIFERPDSTISVKVRLCIDALCACLWQGQYACSKAIVFPRTDQQKAATAAAFQTFIHGLPQCIGVIDGTLIEMRKPNTVQCPQDRDAYWCYKSKFAMLLLAIVNARGKFMYCNVGAPGCVGDASAWNRCALSKAIDHEGWLNTPTQNLSVDVAGLRVERIVKPLVGDGAFRPSVHMLKCYPASVQDHVSLNFDTALCDTRKVVEQAFGSLKMKWQFCHDNKWHNGPQFVRQCICVCCCLHNFCMDQDVTFDDGLISQHLQALRKCVDGANLGQGGESLVAGPAEADARGSGLCDFLASYINKQQ
eukprot:jgi/Ulvmu1/11418/UM075_0080.1